MKITEFDFSIGDADSLLEFKILFEDGTHMNISGDMESYDDICKEIIEGRIKDKKSLLDRIMVNEL